MFQETEKPKLVKVTKALAKKWRDMERFPRDRDLQPARKQFIRSRVESGEFRGSEWVSVMVKETGLEYRVNGKHTSNVLAECFEEGMTPDVTVLTRSYACDTLEDAARLYASFDARQSARTKADIVKGFAAASPDLADVPTRVLTLCTAGLAFNQWEERFRMKASTEDQALLMLQHPDFVNWIYELVGSSSGNSKSRHMYRASVIAAMARTWFKAKGAAKEFWQKIKDDCDDPVNSPPRVLFRFLYKARMNTGGLSTRATKDEIVTEREVFAKCIHAWNAWRRGEKTIELRYYANSKLPSAA